MMKAIRAPWGNLPPNAVVKLFFRTLKIAIPASVAMNALGVASISETNNGEKTPNAIIPMHANITENQVDRIISLTNKFAK